MKTKLLPSREERWDECMLRKELTYMIKCKAFDQFNNFLKQKPELYMFVACDKDGNVLEKPFGYANRIIAEALEGLELEDRFKQYQQALDRVIFYGFEVTETAFHKTISYGNFDIYWYNNNGKWQLHDDIKTLADLTGKVYLNSNGIKDSGI